MSRGRRSCRPGSRFWTRWRLSSRARAPPTPAWWPGRCGTARFATRPAGSRSFARSCGRPTGSARSLAEGSRRLVEPCSRMPTSRHWPRWLRRCCRQRSTTSCCRPISRRSSPGPSKASSPSSCGWSRASSRGAAPQSCALRRVGPPGARRRTDGRRGAREAAPVQPHAGSPAAGVPRARRRPAPWPDSRGQGDGIPALRRRGGVVGAAGRPVARGGTAAPDRPHGADLAPPRRQTCSTCCARRVTHPCRRPPTAASSSRRRLAGGLDPVSGCLRNADRTGSTSLRPRPSSPRCVVRPLRGRPPCPWTCTHRPSRRRCATPRAEPSRRGSGMPTPTASRRVPSCGWCAWTAAGSSSSTSMAVRGGCRCTGSRGPCSRRPTLPERPRASWPPPKLGPRRKLAPAERSDDAVIRTG